MSLLDPSDTDVIIKYQIFYLMRILPREMPFAISEIIIDMLPKSEDLTSLFLTVCGAHPRHLATIPAWVRENADFLCSRIAHESYPRLLRSIPMSNHWRHEAAHVACYDGFLPMGMSNLTVNDVSLDMFVHAKWQDRQLTRLASLLSAEDKCRLIKCNPILIAAPWSKDVRNMQSLVMACVRRDGRLIQYADRALRRQTHIIKAALISDPMALDYVDDDLVDFFVVFVAKLLAVRRKHTATEYNVCGHAFSGRRLEVPKCIWRHKARLELALTVAGAILPMLPAFLQQRRRNAELAMSKGSYPFVSGHWKPCYAQATVEDVHAALFAVRKHVIHLIQCPGRFPVERLPHSLRTDADIMSLFVACKGGSMLKYVPTCCIISGYFWNALFFHSSYLDQKKHVTCIRHAMRKHLPHTFFERQTSPAIKKFWLSFLDLIMSDANKESKHYEGVAKEVVHVLTATKISQWAFWRRVLTTIQNDGTHLRCLILHFISGWGDDFDSRFCELLCKYCHQTAFREVVEKHGLARFMHRHGLMQDEPPRRHGPCKRPAMMISSSQPGTEMAVAKRSKITCGL